MQKKNLEDRLSQIASGDAQLHTITAALLHSTTPASFAITRAKIREWLVSRIQRLEMLASEIHSQDGKTTYEFFADQLKGTLNTFDAGQNAFIPEHAGSILGITVPSTFAGNTEEVIHSGELE